MEDNRTLARDLAALLSPERVLARPLDRVAFASDASFYHLMPQVVVRPQTVAEVSQLFAYSHEYQIPLTFRAAGTSLSGQSVTDGILVDLSRFWCTAQVEQEGALVRLGPGVVGSEANLVLKPYHRRIGPDPASIDAAMLGGMVANNSSGMCCGVVENAYHTLAGMTIVLPNGLMLDTADPRAGQTLAEQAPEVAAGLMSIRAEILADSELSQRIRARYRTKNTTGYSLNAFIDYDTPEQILAHLMVGSEGTLGFIAEVVLHTLPTYPLKSTGLLLFETVQAAAAAVFPLRDSGARAIEFMDRASLRSVENEEGIAPLLRDLPDTAAALLVEYQTETEAEMEHARQAAAVVLAQLPLLRPADFTADPAQQALLWKIRKGLYPSIGGMRRPGSTVLIEDITFPLDRLADAVTDLQALFVQHGYPEGIIFGHAKDGNLHFVLTPSFDTPESIQQYASFIDTIVRLVVEKYDGALKAEHGTGRNMAPFVEAEWGQQAYAFMQRLKLLLDPTGLLNPGVILNSDAHAHLHDLKTWASVEEEVDRCVECGFCEPRCPSRDLTLTPRRRIVVRREVIRLARTGEDPALLESLIKDYQYDGLETCATDGYCALACPVHIDTGLLVKRLRAEGSSQREQSLAAGLARRFGLLEGGLQTAVALGHAAEKVIGPRGVSALVSLAEQVTHATLPKWSPEVPHANLGRIVSAPREAAQVVYFPACITRAMGTSPIPGQPSLPEVLLEVSRRAGLQVWLPPDSHGHCCGMPFSSKGYTRAFREELHRTLDCFWDWSEQGRLPIVIDSSSCAYTLLSNHNGLDEEDQSRLAHLKLYDPVEFAYNLLLPNLPLRPLDQSVVLHPNCSAVKLGFADAMAALARACAREVIVPQHLGCCGFAGDRGLLFPELTQAASRPEADEILQRDYDGYFSSNLTCELGMRQATGKPYQSIFYLLEAASRR